MMHDLAHAILQFVSGLRGWGLEIRIEDRVVHPVIFSGMFDISEKVRHAGFRIPKP